LSTKRSGKSLKPTVGFDPDGPAPPHSGLFGLPFSPQESRVVVVPVPFDATASYGSGAAEAPAAIRSASHQVDLFDREMGHPYRHGIAMAPLSRKVRRWNREARQAARPILDRGGEIGGSGRLRRALERVNELGGKVNDWVCKKVTKLLGEGRLPVVLGGDHSVPFGAIRACAEAHPGMGILHLDAHADLREAYEGFVWSHASIMHNVVTRLPKVSRLVQVGLRDLGEAEERRIRSSRRRIRAHFDADLAGALARGTRFATLAARIVRDLPEEVYVSVDIDGLDPSLCPGTGTPVPGGLSWHQATLLLAELARSGRRVVGADLCEVAPSAGSDWDANVGARLLYKLVGFALLSHTQG
jgi:agmatinase